ncbi:hypothetical protein BYT27DRAFT_7212792 [Phlegmacium glaucopus]|nr:hypothetical protein BYT27DRAFT_7212792 [Phlegmacium glaucopus]
MAALDKKVAGERARGCETRRKKCTKNIVNGYPEWKKDLATIEKLEDMVIRLTECNFMPGKKQRSNSTKTLVFRTNFRRVNEALEESFMSRFGPHYQPIPSLCSYRSTSQTAAMMSLDLKLQSSAMKDLASAKY